MYLPTVDGGRAITDSLTESYHVVNIGRALHGLEPLAPKDGARFHFSLPGSVQGFQADDSPETQGILTLSNDVMTDGNRALALDYCHLARGRAARAYTATFLPPEAIDMPGYTLLASPTLYSGQMVTARVQTADNQAPVNCQLYITVYGAEDKLENVYGPEFRLDAHQSHTLSWRVPDTNSAPIARIGLELTGNSRVDGRLYVDFLTWTGAPTVLFKRPETGQQMWRRAWVDHVQSITFRRHNAFVISHNGGTGLLSQGTRDWVNYRVSTTVHSNLMTAGGIAARVQGINRYYALLLCADRKARLVRKFDDETILAEVDLPWDWNTEYDLMLEVDGNHLRGWVNQQQEFDVVDDHLNAGGIALICADGSIMSNAIRVEAL
jgi:hypothetical protein